MTEHVHRYRLTPLREDEVPKSPLYKKGDYVFCCLECNHLHFGNVWIDKKNPARKGGQDWVADVPK